VPRAQRPSLTPAPDDPMDVVRLIKATGMRAAVAINPATPS
jgi:pentose-5-phosphate-3-epimerase